MPKGYWIVHIDVTNPENYPSYVQAAGPAVAQFSGNYIIRGGTAENREGTAKSRNVVVEFPDFATAQACYDSDAYQAAAVIRQRNAITDFIIVEGN